MDDNTETTKKENKKLARSAKNSAKKAVKGSDVESAADKTEKKNGSKQPSLINSGKCCRCSFRNSDKKCSCKKSSSNGKYVARKSGCENFKYN